MGVCLAGALVALQWSSELRAEGNPTEWLKADGRDSKWVAATARVQDLLTRLECSNGEREKWLPVVRHRCAVLSRLKRIGSWEKNTFVYLAEALLEDLVAGNPPLAGFAGKTIAFDVDAQGRMSADFRRMDKGLPVSIEMQRHVQAALVNAGGVWTGIRKGNTWYAGFGDEIGERRKKYLANAALLVSDTKFAAPKSLIMPGAGYGKGTIAGRMPLGLRAGETRQMYLVFASLGAAKGRTVSLKGLSVALEAVKGTC